MSQSILFISPSAYPLGGVSDWLDYLLPGLSDRSWECILGLVKGRYHDTESYLDSHHWRSVVTIENKTGSPEGRIRSLVKTIESIRPDILAVINIVDVYEAIRRLRLQGKATPRVVMTLHGMQCDLFGDLQDEADVIDAVIATNRLPAKLAEQVLQYEGPVFYAPYGVSISVSPMRKEIENTTMLKLLYSGRLDQQQKRILDLPDLLVALRHHGVMAQISIAGSGPDEAILRDRFKELGMQDQTSFLGVLGHQDLSAAYQCHDALIITSVWETGPIVAWEAMSHGLPVVSSRYVGSGVECALKDGINSILFPVGDIQSAARAVCRLNEPELRARLVQGGLELVHSRYSHLKSVEQWDHALKEVLQLAVKGKSRSHIACLPSGRLDRWLGRNMGERVRRVLEISHPHQDAGGEWPHSRHSYQNQETFLESAKELDGFTA